MATPGPFGEDCLTLNVWTKPQTGEVKKAVLVWIYGGGFTAGSTNTPGYYGTNIASQEDVVVVSIKSVSSCCSARRWVTFLARILECVNGFSTFRPDCVARSDTFNLSLRLLSCTFTRIK